MDTPKFRRATLLDKRDILAITDEEFFDLDGLRSRFDDHFNNPYRLHFLAEINEKVISFTGLKVVDSGRSVYSYGARTHPHYTQQGIQTELLNYAVRSVVDEYTSIDRVLQETWNPTYTDDYFKNNSRKKLLLYQNSFVLTLTTSQCAILLQDEPWQKMLQPQLEQVAPEALSRYVESIEYENNIMFVDYHFFEATKANHEILCELVTQAYIGRNRNGDVSSLSTLSKMPKVEGTLRPRYDIHVNSYDTNQALTHVVQHIHDILSDTHNDEGQFELFIRFCNEINRETMYNFLVNPSTRSGICDGVIPKSHWKMKGMELKGIL